MHQEKQTRALELPEIISGLLVLGAVVVEGCFFPYCDEEPFFRSIHLVLCGLVWANSLCSLTHALAALVRKQLPGRDLALRLLLSLIASFVFFCGVKGGTVYWISMNMALGLGLLSCFNTFNYIRGRRRTTQHERRRRWSPSAIFFTTMVSLVFVSALLLMTPGAHNGNLSFMDALFTCASATSITGLTCIDIAQDLTPIGQTVVLIDFQVGALGVMTFTYLILLMMGKRLNLLESSAMAAILDQEEEGTKDISALLKIVCAVTGVVELIGAGALYLSWEGNPAVPHDDLIYYAIFHSVSAFCNAGITLFSEGLATQSLSHSYGSLSIILTLVMAGTVGFGVYREGLIRLKRHWGQREKNNPRWSTHSWLVMRVSIIVLIIGFIGLLLLAWCEPSRYQPESAVSMIWESLWNTIGRSAGFNLNNLDNYGPVYKLYMCVLMFVGGNPAGTGGGVFAPVVALCVLEIFRVLRGKRDVEIHYRRISRHTVERAMATIVLSIFWIIATTMILQIVEEYGSATPPKLMHIFFLEVSAYTTTGYALSSPADLTLISKLVITLNMLFGRMGMFTFMLLFIKPQKEAPFRYPETRLPLS